MKWRAEFVGREIGAIGVFHPVSIEVEGDTADEANLNIYATHEHVFKLSLTPLLHECEDASCEGTTSERYCEAHAALNEYPNGWDRSPSGQVKGGEET